MNRSKRIFHLLIVAFFILSSLPVQAQVFQKLHAYDVQGQLRTGEYRDIAWIGDAETTALVGIGTSFDVNLRGLVSICDPLGNPFRFLEFTEGTNSIEAVAIDNAPNGDLIAVFFNYGVNATDIFRLDGGGNLLWGKRLPGIRALDLKVDACNYPGGEGIWVTGYSTANNKFSVEGLNGNGVQMFAREYDVSNAVFGISSSQGSEIEYDQFNDELVVIGYGQVTGNTAQVMLFTRVDLGGNWNLGTAIFDPFFNATYLGESLFKDPQMGKYIVAFDYEVAGDRTFAACELAYNGFPTWINQYTAGGVFSTNFAKVTGIRHFGPTVLMSGYYLHSSGFPRAMSMAIDPQGGPGTVSAYPTNGSYPIQSSVFWGMDINPNTGYEYMVGNFRTPATGGTWPAGSNPSSFYMIATDQTGQSACHDFDFQGVQALDPKVIENIHAYLNLPAVTNTPMLVEDVEWLSDDECPNSKRALVEEVASPVELSYQADGTINLHLPAEEQGNFDIQLVDLQGKVLSTFTTQSGTVELPTQGLSAGIYLVRFEGSNHSGVKKFMIRH